MKDTPEYTGQCQYHYGTVISGLSAVRLTPDGGKEWQEVHLICSPCRKHLQGMFRYAKVKDDTNKISLDFD